MRTKQKGSSEDVTISWYLGLRKNVTFFLEEMGFLTSNKSRNIFPPAVYSRVPQGIDQAKPVNTIFSGDQCKVTQRTQPWVCLRLSSNKA